MVFVTEVDELSMFVTEFDCTTEGDRLVFALKFCSTVFVKGGDSTGFGLEADDIHVVFWMIYQKKQLESHGYAQRYQLL